MQIATLMMKIKLFFTKKAIIWTIVIFLVLFGFWFFFIKKSTSTNIQTAVVKIQDIQKTVLTTGQVVSSTDLNLSFQTSGVIRQINVKEGDVVGTGQTLAILDQGSVSANLESAQGSLASAQANYNKILAAATSQDIAVSQANVDAANTTLSNAKQNLINQISVAYNNANTVVLSNTNNLFSNPQSMNPQFGISGTNQTNQQLTGDVNSKRVVINAILSKWQTEILTLNDNNVDVAVSDSFNNLSTISSYLSDIINLLTSYTQVTSGGSQTTLTTYTTTVTTAKSTVDAAYTAITTYDQAIKSAQSSLAQAKASLALKQAPTRPEDVEIARAQVLSAQGTVRAAEVAVSNTILRAPASGTITQVDIKLGEQAQAMKQVIKLLNVGELHTEALVSESDIAAIAVGQSIDNTFDALGPEKHFTTKVLTVNPASTVISGVVNYKVTGSLEKISEVKPGMTSNMTIMVAEKKAVLAIPSSSVVNKDNKRFVKVVDDPKTKTYHEVEVQTGLEADGGLTEVISGLTEGQEVVTYIKK